jgi:subtilisin family serine protease
VGDDGGPNQIGMAPGAEWIGCRNMNLGAGTPATYLECFEFFLAPYPVGGDPQDGNPDLAPHVTNNSWGCPPTEGCTTTSELLAAVQAQRAAGILTVSSAGNDGPDCATVNDPPGIYADVFSVGALTKGTDTIASFSSRGVVDEDGSNRLKPDLVAPGTSIRSSTADSNSSYGPMFGTSMASPHVSGAVALLWSARPFLIGQVGVTERILRESAFDISSAACNSSGWPNNTYGYGRLDVLAAVNLAPSQSGGLTGVVSNSLSLAGIPGASLQATYALTPSLQFDFASALGGQFTQTVFAGAYTLTASAPGYAPAVIGGVMVSPSLTTTVQIQLTPLTIQDLYLPLVTAAEPGGAARALRPAGERPAPATLTRGSQNSVP